MDPKTEILNFMNQIFTGKRFIGQYAERRLVGKLNSYRDLILICNSEKQIQQDMETIRRWILNKKNCTFQWIGMTCPSDSEAPNGYCFWTYLPNVPLGYHVFQIQGITYELNEIVIEIKKIRSIPNRTNILQEKGLKDVDSHSITSDASSLPTEWYEYFKKIQQSTLENMSYFFSNILKPTNIVLMVKYVILLLMTAIIGGFEVLKFLGDFTVKLVHELSLLLQASTPILLGIMDFFSKIIGGILILISMLWNKPQKQFMRDIPGDKSSLYITYPQRRKY